jgi:hypothetical protein
MIPYASGFIVVVKKRSGIQTFFSTTPYAAIPSFGTLFMESGIRSTFSLVQESICFEAGLTHPVDFFIIP